MQLFLLTNFNLYYFNQSEMHIQTDAAPHIYYQINKNKNLILLFHDSTTLVFRLTTSQLQSTNREANTKPTSQLRIVSGNTDIRLAKITPLHSIFRYEKTLL